MSLLSTRTAPHLPWSLNAATAPPEVAAAVTAAASAEALGVTPEAPSGQAVRLRGGGKSQAGGGGGDEAMADAAPKAAAADPRVSGRGATAEAEEAAAAEAAVDAVGADGAALG